MSVLIKGMEMPETCYDCRFFVCEEGFCKAIRDFRGFKINQVCPLVELPQYGRLINATQFMQYLEDNAITDDDREFCNKVKYSLAKAPNAIELGESRTVACFASARCHRCKHCVEDEIETGLTGLECEEGMESFYNGSTEGCWQYEKREDDDEYSD